MRILLTTLYLTLSLAGCGHASGAKEQADPTPQPVDSTQATDTVARNNQVHDTIAAPLPDATREDRQLVERILRTTHDHYAAWGKEKTILWIARQFIGVPYVAHTLDRSDTEQMVINLHELDCTTYVEAVLALARCTFAGKTSFADYCREARLIRYMSGKVDYCGRLHYFQWWVSDNERKGFIQEIHAPSTLFTGRQHLRIDYMSTHADSYDMLRQHPERVKTIAQQEKAWLGKTVTYIPKGRLKEPALRKVVHDGDILGLVTNKPGLDASHLGIAVWHEDGLYLLNASSLKKNGHQVVEPKETLFAYLAARAHNTGIRVLRISE